MRIGLAKDERTLEKRVALRPEELAPIARRHQVLVERGAGRGVGITDDDYARAGATPVKKEKVYACPLVVKLREPNEPELRLMTPGSAVFSMLHLINRLPLAKNLRRYRVNGIAMEKIKDRLGERMIEDLHELGYAGMMKAFELWGGRPERATVKIMGSGRIALGAVQAASRREARVILLNRRDINEMERHLPGTDILVDGLSWPQELRGKVYIVTRSMLKLMNRGGAVIGLVSNPSSKYPVETMHPTSLSHISYRAAGVLHAACWGWSGLDPMNVTRRYSIQIAPVLADIAAAGGDYHRLPEYIRAAWFEGGA